jgi:hypothetical protein
MPCDELFSASSLVNVAHYGSGKLHFLLGQFSIFSINASIHLPGDDSTASSVMLRGGTLFLVKIFYTS